MRQLAKVRIRYFVRKRDRRGGEIYFYWQPSAELNRQGWRTVRLSSDLQQALIEAQQQNQRLDSWRRGEIETEITPDTIPWLIRLYVKDDRYTSLAATTRIGYDYCLRIIEKWSQRAGHLPLATLKRKHVSLFYASMRENTPAKANAVVRVLRILMGFAVDEGFIDHNPASRPRMKGHPPRRQSWNDESVPAFCSTAQEADRHSLALAVLIGANTGQRQGDILRLTWQQYDGQDLTLRQSKTGVLVSIPVTNEIKIALDITRETARLRLLRSLSLDLTDSKVDVSGLIYSKSVIVFENTDQPYNVSTFRHEFRRIAGIAGLHDLQFRDLRRTAVVRLAEAGCTIPQISSITGHQLDRTLRILETYLPRNTEMARAAIHTLESHRNRTKLETG
jgi:integrase